MTSPTIRRIAMTGALALTVLGISVPAASAGKSDTITIKTTRGVVQFQENGNILMAKDNKEDGVGVKAKVSVNGRPLVPLRASHARNKPVNKRRLSLREGTVLQLELCHTRKDGSEGTCTIPKTARA